MTELSRFLGIVISVFFKDHGVPHLHAFHGGHVGVYRISDGVLLAGKLPKSAQKLVKYWIESHRDDLLEAFEKAKQGKNPSKIPGLKVKP